MSLITESVRAQIIQSLFTSVNDLAVIGQECPICRLEIADPVRPPMCSHIYCRDCIDGWLVQSGQHSCPYCRKQLSIVWSQFPIAVRRELLEKMNLAEAARSILEEGEGDQKLAQPGAEALAIPVRDSSGRLLTEHWSSDSPAAPHKPVLINFDDLLAPLTVAGLVMPSLEESICEPFNCACWYNSWATIVASLHKILEDMHDKKYDAATLSARLVSRLCNHLGRTEIASKGTMKKQMRSGTGLAPCTMVLIESMVAIVFHKHHEKRFADGRSGRIHSSFDDMWTAPVRQKTSSSETSQAKMIPTSFDFY